MTIVCRKAAEDPKLVELEKSFITTAARSVEGFGHFVPPTFERSFDLRCGGCLRRWRGYNVV